MLPFLKIFAPIVFAFGKEMASNTIADHAENAIEVYLKNLFTEFCTNSIINVTALFLSIYVMPFIFNSEVVRFLVCSVYLSSMLHALYNFFFKYLRLVINLEKEISDQANREIGNLGLLQYIGYFFFSSKQEVVDIIRPIIMRAIFGFVLKHGLAIVIYIGIFRVIVAPWAVEDATGLNWYEAAIYPFLMAFDYFFGFETQDIFIPID